MSWAGTCARRRKRTTVPDPAVPPAPDLIGRDFTATAPDQRWCGDITYLRVGAGWLYLATVIEIATRRLVGWSINTHMHTTLVIDALDAAVTARRGRVDGVIFHSDRGAQYSSSDFADACQRHGIRRSMGRIGSSYENALAEAYIATLKRELDVDHATGHPRPTPAATSSDGSRSTTTDATTPRWATSAPPTTNKPAHQLRCTRSRHNPVSTSRGEPQYRSSPTCWRRRTSSNRPRVAIRTSEQEQNDGQQHARGRASRHRAGITAAASQRWSHPFGPPRRKLRYNERFRRPTSLLGGTRDEAVE